MKQLLKGALVWCALSLTISDAGAQVIVRVRPARPRTVVVRPAAPSPAHVWVEEDWVGRGRRYRWHGGYWVAPPRNGVVWVPGHWEARRRGEVWVPGYWR